MSSIFTKPGPGQWTAAGAGLLLIASLFLPWASAGGVEKSGWELLSTTDLYLLIVALIAIGTALTGGRFGVFRHDLSLNAAADLLALVAIVLLAWQAIFDFPQGSDRELGIFVALAAAIAVAAGVGDYRPLRGGVPWFPPLGDDGRSGA